MKEIIESNYKVTVDRGLISPRTSVVEFIEKLDEERKELEEAIAYGTLSDIKEELSDVILVCLNLAHHHGFDIESELQKKIQKNAERIR